MLLSDRFSELPLEILGEILMHCAASDPDAPTHLAAISRQLHNAVNATPGVWQRLNLSLAAHSEEACIRKANLWFSRAATCNVFLHVELKQYRGTDIWACDNPVGSLSRDLSGLGFALRQFSVRIQLLAVEATSARDAHAFISSIYYFGTVDEELNIGLRHLTVKIDPDEGSTTATPSTSSSNVKYGLRLPRGIQLYTLRLVNQIPPCPSCVDCKLLRSLTITRPIRSSPLPLQTILKVLRATSVLAYLEISGRIVIAPHPQGEDKEENKEAEENDHTAPLTLSSLTHLSLRSNLIPPLISSLIMPELHTLRLDDLDGRRVNASVETSTMLRQLLVRMELPRETRKGSGLKILELTSVSIQPPTAKGDDIWGWCFTRMRTLEHLYLKNVNVDGLIDILLSPSRPLVNTGGRSEVYGELVCPCLQSLSIITNRPSRYITAFERMRRSVKFEYTLVDDLLNHVYYDFSSNPSPMPANDGSNGKKGGEN